MILRSPVLSAFSLAFILFITACSTVRTGKVDQVERILLYQAKSGALGSINWWVLKGRLAVNDGKDGGSGHLNWQKQGQSNYLKFHGALGRGAWQLIADEQGAVLEWANGESYRAASASDLLEEQLGWTIPVPALLWWVRGLAAPGAWSFRQLDEQGNLEQLNQLGWKIEYGRYTEAGSVLMPRSLTARRQSYTVKFAIQDWDLTVGKSSND